MVAAHGAVEIGGRSVLEGADREVEDAEPRLLVGHDRLVGGRGRDLVPARRNEVVVRNEPQVDRHQVEQHHGGEQCREHVFVDPAQGEQYLVKDGDFLALGHHKLRFYMTPMVHWPETMMTFDETEGILFSGDGFGCFGTLDGGFLDTGMNVDRYWGEMVRYYSNIVGKYGSPVQKALQKLGGLPISAICSTHGDRKSTRLNSSHAR